MQDTKPTPGSNRIWPRVIEPLYRHAQPAPERDKVRSEHAEWSQATFGNVGPVGPLKHLAKEAIEAAAEPDDLSEWADMQFLMWDAQRRAGITDEQITQAMIEKLAVNKQRSWPEPKDGEPRLHIKEQSAPVVPEKATVGEMPFLGTSEGVYVRGWNDCRAAMLQCAENTESRCGIQTAPVLDSLPKTAESRCGNSPVIPEGYVMVPKDLLSELRDWAHPEIEKYCEMWEGRRDSEFPALRKVIADADALLAASPQEVKGE
ncbi:dATP/dGTP pyrophosphohydrolase domain-containing protein [Klebsiella michiganensis]|uniref:dATP/dGTP pyrophosphohydrolase domain-containing protein n=1 Tax=Klebsiella michiganensis TaxID=1134687 RepID=UPI003F8D1361